MNNFAKGNMRRLLVLATVVLLAEGAALRVPKIYNALISSDENLTPSHAYPVLEPVLRTTALGVAFPPIIVHPPTPKENKKEDDIGDAKDATTPSGEPSEGEPGERKKEKPSAIPQLAYHGSLYPLAYDPYFPYGYTSDFLFPALPFYQQPVLVDFTHFEGNKKEKEAEAPAKPTATANFKKNPEIPDVPPPPLPIKDEKKRKA